MLRAERAIRRAGLLGLLALGLAVPAAYYIVPAILELPESMPERLAFAARASSIVMLCVLVAVGMVSSARRSSPADIGGSAAGPPSPKLAIRVAFLQNTLEQAILAVVLYFGLASLLSGDWLSLIVVGVIFFVVGRVLFLRGYAGGAEGRALGMSVTMIPTAVGYGVAITLMVVRWI